MNYYFFANSNTLFDKTFPLWIDFSSTLQTNIVGFSDIKLSELIKFISVFLNIFRLIKFPCSSCSNNLLTISS